MDSRKLGRIIVNQERLFKALASKEGVWSRYAKEVMAICDLGVVLYIMTVPPGSYVWENVDGLPPASEQHTTGKEKLMWYVICSEDFEEIEPESEVPEYSVAFEEDGEYLYISELERIDRRLH